LFLECFFECFFEWLNSWFRFCLFNDSFFLWWWCMFFDVLLGNHACVDWFNGVDCCVLF
jgi:hypothetical protein